MKKKNSWIQSLFLIGIFLLNACSFNQEKSLNKMAAINDKITDIPKYPMDKNQYMYVLLDNGLKVMLVSNKKTKKSGAFLFVRAASADEPSEYLGLAHFLEHMLFVKNKKYPEVDGFRKYIESYGGQTNAYTGVTKTAYYFTIGHKKLLPALDRFAQFFVSPMLDKKFVNREKHAVDSEFSKDLDIESDHVWSVVNHIASQKNNTNRFSIGNLSTLKDNDNGVTLTKTLQTFFNKYYVGSNMALTVYGSEPLETLKENVQKAFFGLKVGAGEEPQTYYNSDRSDQLDRPVYDKKSQLGVRVNIEGKSAKKTLYLVFPAKHSVYSKESSFFSFLINYKGRGGLNDFLVKKHLAFSVRRGFLISSGTIAIDLTDEGFKQIDQVTNYVFDYLHKLRKSGLHKWYQEEYKAMKQLKLLYSSTESVTDFIEDITNSLSYYSNPRRSVADDYFSNLFFSFSTSQFSAWLDDFSVKTMQQIVVAKGLKTNKETPYIKAKYGIYPLSKELLTRFQSPQEHPEFVLPKKNRFLKYVPSSIDIKAGEDSTVPEKIIDKKGLTVWAINSSAYQVPKGNIKLRLSSQYASNTPKQVATGRLFSQLFQAYLDDSPISRAKKAGLLYNISYDEKGIFVEVWGYDSKQNLLLNHIIKAIKNFPINEESFKQKKNKLLADIKQQLYGEPNDLVFNDQSLYLYPNLVKPSMLMSLVKQLTIKDIENYIKQLQQSLHVNMLVYGNHNRSDALAFGHLVESELLQDSTSSDVVVPSFRELKETVTVLNKNYDSQDAVFALYMQGPKSYAARSKYSLLAQLLSSQFFSELRTHQQLGYLVSFYNYALSQHAGLKVIIQSNKYAVKELEKRIRVFFKTNAVDFLNKMTDKELQETITTFNDSLKTPAKTFYVGADRLWGMIDTQEPFGYRNLLIQEANKVTKQDLLQVLKRINSHKGELIIQSAGKFKEK